MSSVLHRPPTTDHPAVSHIDLVERRRAALVAAIAGLVLVPWFWVANAATSLRGDPETEASAQRFLDFYADNVARIPVRGTAFVLMWVLILVLVVAVVRAATSRLGLAAVLAITLAGGAVTSAVVAEGVLVWPTFAFRGVASDLVAHLDPEVARSVVLSRDGLHAPAAVLIGISLLLVAWLLARSDLWGRRAMAMLTAIIGAFSAATLLLGPESFGPSLIGPWGLVIGILLLVARRGLVPSVGSDR
jgi:hypothetical protein